MQFNFYNIPHELKERNQWVLWKTEVRNGKETKVPYQSDGAMAQSNNRRTWSSFHSTINAYNKGGYDGIGFMFSREDPFIGIDIDDCVEGDKLSSLAEEIIEMMDSYTEISPSGNGIHIIVQGELPIERGTGKKNSKLGLECYRYGRYFTFTGNSQNVDEVIERTDELGLLFQKYFGEEKPDISHEKNQSNYESFSNMELWERMFQSKNGQMIKSLFDGNLINDDHSSTDLTMCNHLAFWTNKDAFQMDSMFRETALMRDKWDKVHHSSGETYGERTIAIAIASTFSTYGEWLQENEKFNIRIRADEVETDNVPFFKLTELGNAERLIYHHGKNLKYCNELEWLIWNGKYWEVDEKREIESIAAKTFRSLYRLAEKEADADLRKALEGWARKCERRSIRMNSILDARPMVSVKKTEFDSHEYLLNCENGIVDLKTGELLPHDRDKLITKITSVPYEKNSDCPNWIAFLESIFKDSDGKTNYELIDFIQKAVGYTLTGDISEQVMFFLYGTGRNGKSTFINIIQDLLGDYGRQTNSDTFIKKKHDNSINNDVARLDGARFVSAVESEEGQQLSESLVKQITGGEKISARFLRQEFFEFTPEFKVFFTTNHVPIIRNNDEGIWRRIRLIPFTVTIPKEKIDKSLPEKLKKEMPGILRWAVDGCLKWQQEGLGEPKAVREATQNYRDDMDILGPFLKERCIEHPLAKVEAKQLFEEYKNWCFEYDEAFPLKNRSFYRAIETRGFKKDNGAQNRVFFFGIGLNSSPGFSEQKVNEQVNEVNKKDSFVNQNKVTSINRIKL